MRRTASPGRVLTASLIGGVGVALLLVFVLAHDRREASDKTASASPIRTDLVAQTSTTGTATRLAGIPNLYESLKGCYQSPEDLLVATPPTPNTYAELQLPDLDFGTAYPDYSQYDGQNISVLASSCGQTLIDAFAPSPQSELVFSVLAGASDCAQKQGLGNWRVYQRHRNAAGVDDPGLGIMVVLSKNTAQRPLELLRDCLADAVIGGGAGGGAQSIYPCGGLYGYFNVNPSSYRDTYHVIYAGLEGDASADSSICEDMVLFQLGERRLEGSSTSYLRASPSGLQTYLVDQGYAVVGDWYW